jgi:hypothetical protein
MPKSRNPTGRVETDRFEAHKAAAVDGPDMSTGCSTKVALEVMAGCDCPRENMPDSFDVNKHKKAIEALFPSALPESVFIDHMTKVLETQGFTPETAINLVSSCRDEICRSFTDCLDAKWGPSFNISSLAGMIFCGKTAFKAAMSHSPLVNGKERYVFWVAPHIALSPQNEIGKCWRPGRTSVSSACGALLALLGELKGKSVNVKPDPNDLEMIMLKQNVMSHLPQGDGAQEITLTQLTYAVHECILEDVRRTAAASTNLDMCEYVIISGIQVHCGFSETFWWPGSVTKYTKNNVEDLCVDFTSGSVARDADEFFLSQHLKALHTKHDFAMASPRHITQAAIKGTSMDKLSSSYPVSEAYVRPAKSGHGHTKTPSSELPPRSTTTSSSFNVDSVTKSSTRSVAAQAL